MRSMTSLGLSACRRSQPRPQPSSVPGLKFSITTSASAASARTASWPSRSRRSAHTDRLLRDCTSHHTEVPSRSSLHLRSGSPTPGGSTLITSAPKSASVLPANGPAMSCPSSSTLIPWSACIAAILRARGERRLRRGMATVNHPRCFSVGCEKHLPWREPIRSFMNKILTLSLACLGAFGAVSAAQAQSFPDRARVVASHPVIEQIPVDREECWNDRVRGYEDHRVTRSDTGAAIGPGTVLGAIVGGVVGHQVGRGRGNDVATAAGAIAGGLVGNQIDRDNAGPPESVTEVDRVPVERNVKRCRTVHE